MNLTLDLKTVYVLCSSLTAAVGACMVLVHLTGKLYPGFRYWTIAVLSQAAALILFANGKGLPPFLSLVVGNVIYCLYPMCLSRGLRLFAGRTAPVAPIFAGLIYQGVATSLFAQFQWSTTGRVAIAQVAALPFAIDCAWVVWTDPAFRYPIVRPWLAGVFLVIVSAALARVGLLFAIEAGAFHAWTALQIWEAHIIVATAVGIAAAVGLILLNFQRAARSLGESEERYRHLIEMSPEGITVHRDGTIVYANPAAVRMFGARSADQLVGRQMLELIHPDFRALALARRKSIALNAVGGPLAEMRYVRIDGTSFEVETQSAPIVFDGAAAVQIAAHETSALKQAASRQREFERKLQETQKLESLGVLAGGIAHDFNNILTGILTNASLVDFELPQGSPARENVGAIQEGSRQAADLCRQMLSYSGQGNFVVRAVSVCGLVQETAKLLKGAIGKSVRLNLDLPEELPLIEADASQIRQVIMNLLINASEAIGDTGGSISVRAGVTVADSRFTAGAGPALFEVKPGSSCVLLEVSDTGCGMSAQTRARIFDPFFSTKFAGRGLGLSVVLGIVRSHKGAMRVDSEPGKGTTFRILFPLASEKTAPALAVENVPGGWQGRGRALLVDDDASIRKGASAMLRKLGFEVETASTGAESVAMVRADPERFTLIFMDLTMPEMDGRQALTEIRGIRKNLPVVLMSGYSERDAVSPPSAPRASGFLAKPFGFEELIRLIQRIVPGDNLRGA